MSSKFVRDTIKAHVAAAFPLIKTADLSAGYERMDDFLSEFGITLLEDWVGYQFVGNDEVPVTVASVAGQGKFREVGAIFIHVVGVAKLGVRDSILTRCEPLRTLFRGKNISGIRVQSVTPPNFELGSTLEFESGFIAASFIAEYDYDLDI